MNFFRRLATQWGERYRKMSIQMVLSLSFTAVALVGVVFMGGSLLLRFSDSARNLSQQATRRVLAQVNLNLDSYLRRMMRVSDTMYYRVIKNTDLASDTLDEEMGLLYEENRDALVSIALFDAAGRLVEAAPLSGMKASAEPSQSRWFRAAAERMAWVSASLPPEVKVISLGEAPMQVAIRSRASSRALSTTSRTSSSLFQRAASASSRARAGS